MAVRGSRFPAGVLLPLLCACFLLASVTPTSADVVYLYDPLGRLVRVIGATGESGTYLYDPVGNILQIARQSGISQDQTAIASVDPPTGAQGTQVTLTFTGTNLAGASLPSLPTGFTFVSSSFAVSGNQDLLTVTLALDPALALGQYSLTLVSSLGGATPLPFTLNVVLPPPRIDRVIPPLATIGSLVQVEGNAFDAANPSQNQVTINGVALPVISLRSTALIAQVGPGVTTGSVQVTTSQGTALSPAPLTVIPGTHPQQNQVTATLRSPFRAPVRIAVSPIGSRAYVLNAGVDALGQLSRGGDSVTAVDTAQDAVLTVIPVSVNPSALAVTPDGSRVLVTDLSLPFELKAIDAATLGVSATLALPTTSRDVVVSPDGTLASVALDTPAVWLVDVATLAQVASVSLADRALYLALSPDGHTLYAIGASTLSLIDVATRTVTRTVSLFLVNGVTSFALDPVAQRLYVGGLDGLGAGRLKVVDLAAGTVLTTLSTAGPPAVALSPDRSRLYVAGTDDQLIVRNAATLATLGSVTVERGRPAVSSTQAIRVSADGATLWVVNTTDNTVSVVDTQALVVMATVPVGLAPGALGLIQGGTALYVLNSRSNTVSVLDTATHALRATALERFGLAQPLGLFALPDGSAGYVVNGLVGTTTAFTQATGAGLATLLAGDSHAGLHLAAGLTRTELYVGTATPPGVAVLDLGTRAQRAFLPMSRAPRALALSLDERRLYVASDVSTNSGTTLATFDVPSRALLAQLTLHASFVTDQILLNPEGTRLYVLHPTQGASQTGLVRVIDTASQTEVGTIPVGTQGQRLAWNPRLGRLSVVNSTSVSVIDPATNQVVATIPVSGFGCCTNLVFTLDGSKAYLGGFGVLVLNTGTNTVTTTLSSGFFRGLAVSPDGQRLFASQEFGQVTVINTTTDLVVTTIQVGRAATTAQGGFRAINVAFSPDGARAWVTNTLDDTLSVIE